MLYHEIHAKLKMVFRLTNFSSAFFHEEENFVKIAINLNDSLIDRGLIVVTVNFLHFFYPKSHFFFQ